jgi:hypothetical protein
MIFGALQDCAKASYNLKRLLLYFTQNITSFVALLLSLCLFSQLFLFIGLTGTGQVCKWISSAFYPTTVKALLKCFQKAMLRIHRIRIFFGLLEVRIRIQLRILILLSSSKITKKNFDSYCFVTSLWLFIFEKWWKCTVKSNKQKILFWRLEVNFAYSRIRILVWIY